MTDGNASRNRMLALITIVLVTAALRASYSVTMPIAVSGLVIAAIWPVKPWLDRALPSSLSYIGTALVLFFVLIGFLAQVVRAFTQSNWHQFEKRYKYFAELADQWGVTFGAEDGYARLIGFGQSLLSDTYTIFVYIAFIALLVVLGLPEVPALRKKLRNEFDAGDRREVIEAADEIAGKIRQYLALTTMTSLITGVASATWAFAAGLDLALVWDVLNFLLNYIPVIGNLVGIVPPTLYALIQFQTWTMPVVVFVGFGVLQIVISNFVSPMLQGRSLLLSPITIILALSFWSWVWGAGALIAVPLTVALVIGASTSPARGGSRSFSRPRNSEDVSPTIHVSLRHS